MSLSDLPVNQFTASELVRLCLRHHDAASVDDNSDIDNEDVVDADDEVVSHQLLNSSAEFFDHSYFTSLAFPTSHLRHSVHSLSLVGSF